MSDPNDIPSILCLAAGVNLLLWVPIGALIGHFARGRAIEGGGLGFLFGPIGWALIAALKDRRRLCPECRARVPGDARKCKHCGSSLMPSPAPRPVPTPPRKPPVKAQVVPDRAATCPHCRVKAMKTVEMGQAVLTCPQCGERL